MLSQAHKVRFVWLVLLSALAFTVSAQTAQRPIIVRRGDGQSSASGQALPPAQPGEAFAAQQIKALLNHQAADWNRGDLDAFAQGYKHSPDILFIGGNTIRRGYDGMLQRYKDSYPNRERMGNLTFSELEVQPLGPQFATSTGHFHLERSATGGGNADGFFLLVLEKTPGGWKIVRDDTSSLPVKQK